MKKLLLLLSVLLVTLSACNKKDSFDPVKQAAEDDAKIQAYLKANNIDAIKDESGLYYKVMTPGTGAYPTSSSTVSVAYNGKLLDGSSFDSGNLSNYPLPGLIPGWQIGIPHINNGGRILLIVPSGLAYGNSSPGAGVPANAVLVFTIDLLSFK